MLVPKRLYFAPDQAATSKEIAQEYDGPPWMGVTILVFSCYLSFGVLPICLRSFMQRSTAFHLSEVVGATVVGLAGLAWLGFEVTRACKSLSSQVFTQRRSIAAVLSAVSMGVASVVLSAYISLNWWVCN